MNSSKIDWIYAGLGIAAGVGLVVAVSRKSKRTKIPRVGPNDRVLLVGDSLSQGISVPLKQLVEGAGIPFASDTRPGTRISQWAKNSWLPSMLNSFRPTITIVSLGTNDMMLPDPSVETEELSGLVQTILAAGSQIVFISPPAMPFPDRGVRAMLASHEQPIFPSEQLQLPRAPDGIHSTTSGYAGWAGALWRWLSPDSSGLGAAPMRRRVVPRKVQRRF